jgi:hypothetical protein
MKKIALALVFLLINSPVSFADDDSKKESKGNNLEAYADELPKFTLKDVHGKKYTNKDIAKDGAILVVTAPILKNKDAQEGWGEYLDKEKAEKPKLVFLQDMEASNFKAKARKAMKKESKKNEEPIMLMDEKGSVREKLKVKQKDTVILVYNDNGKLIYAEEGKPSSASAKKIWESAKD